MWVEAMPSWVLGLGTLVVLALPFWVWAVIRRLQRRRFLREVRSRPDHYACWRASFPDDMATVDRTLTIFCDAFMFEEQHKYHLVPEDSVAVFYKNTTGPISDELQYENLVIGIDKAFGVDITEHDCDESLNLGDLVRHVLNSMH